MVGPLCRLQVAARVLRARGGTGAASGARRASGEAHGTVHYRQFPEQTRSQLIKSEIISSTMWFWILWHFWHSPDDVLGHFPYPDSSKWTNEELGIPPDDE
ncbi:NADH dehydrogenase [ubiquinone] 1 beta subcomplex subunit 2, mitochondrial [Eublepharis macularius]|uniref:NADH dehydrogenase [ubiquinone] 1 beta subcomplex subunit 2, mitochondrial n=1 Tax=Eublepharis macularius TaxID=481883 RepID=A0AA97JW72_EUBMA|nr:NADH dehydrogenase [ubiquinone] 1 beta subcomplex subunit 2, mitochondrial [Eublepharis macularius]XP_054845415.1 NADH dehydrogenase [ubiquinone] 1 beta subcomplex subunit 2, mitochondrial [Eublepharis macularius]